MIRKIYDNMKLPSKKQLKANKHVTEIDFSRISFLLDPNNGCNLNCIHCGLACAHLEHFSRQELMSPEKFGQVIKLIEPYANALSIGCIREPLVHPEIEKILTLADNLPRQISLSLTTNGLLLKQPLINMFAQSLHDWVFYVSIESADSKIYEKIRRGAKFESFHRNMEDLCALKAKRSGIKIYFSTVVMKANFNALEELFEYADKMGVDGFLLMDLEPLAHNEHLMLSDQEKKEWPMMFQEFKGKKQASSMLINKNDEDHLQTDLMAVLNQKGDLYPTGFRKPLCNIFDSTAIKTILAHYQNTINSIS